MSIEGILTPAELEGTDEGEEIQGEEAPETPAVSTEPPPPPPNPELEALRKELERERAERERDRENFHALMNKVGQPQQQEPAEDIDKQIAETLGNLNDESREVMLRILALQDKRYARRDAVERVESATGAIARTTQEREVLDALKRDGLEEKDLAAVKAQVEKMVQQGRRWDSLQSAYKEAAYELTRERGFKKADEAYQRKLDVDARAQRHAQPTGEAQSTGGKVAIDVREIRKKAGRRMSTAELAEAVAKLGG